MKTIKDTPCENCTSSFYAYFNIIGKTDIQVFNQRKLTYCVKKGQVIFKEGNTSFGVYCIREGKIKVFKLGTDGREHITRVVMPGELLGLKALLTGNDHSVSAVAIEDSMLCFINKNDFLQLMIKHPDFTRSLILVLGKLLDEAETRMISIAYKPVKERLAETLLFLFNSFYPETKEKSKLYLNLTRMDLANIIGTAQETVIRLLSEFKKEDLIEIKGRKIFLLNPSKLQVLANL